MSPLPIAYLATLLLLSPAACTGGLTQVGAGGSASHSGSNGSAVATGSGGAGSSSTTGTGTGGAGGSAPAGRAGADFVAGGVVSTNGKHTFVGSLGQSPGVNAVSAGGKYRFVGGLVGATQP